MEDNRALTAALRDLLKVFNSIYHDTLLFDTAATVESGFEQLHNSLQELNKIFIHIV